LLTLEEEKVRDEAAREAVELKKRAGINVC
jgi:hypothetical protein